MGDHPQCDLLICLINYQHTVGDWEACGDAFFNRELLYDMAWEDTDLDNKRFVARAMCGIRIHELYLNGSFHHQHQG